MPILLAFIALTLLVALIIVIWKKNTHKKKFNDAPRTSGEEIEELYEDEENTEDDDQYLTVKQDIVRSGDEVFDTFVPIEELFKEAGIVDVQDGLFEFDEGDGTKTFVGIAEMEQSNPYLKTTKERLVEDAEYQLFLMGQAKHFKISLQWNVTDMHEYFNEMRKNIADNPNENLALKKIGNDVINAAEDFEHSGKRFENHIYVQFIEKVSDTDISDAENKDELTKYIYEVANRKINNDIGAANEVLRACHHELHRLYNIDNLELIYKTFNRKTSRIIPFDRIIRDQKFSMLVSAPESDSQIERISEMVQAQNQTKTFMQNDPKAIQMRNKLKRQFDNYMQYRDSKYQNSFETIQNRKDLRLKQEINNSKSDKEDKDE